MGKKARVIRTCQNCGNQFETFPCEVKKGHAKFCSRRCATIYKNTHFNPAWDKDVKEKISRNHADVSGCKNPMYMRRGKDAPGYIDGRNSFDGETYRRILSASGKEKKCSICGTVDGLQVHHIDGNHKNNSIENLSWVCVHCHMTVAHEYIRDSRGRFLTSVTHDILKEGDYSVHS